MSQLTTPRVFAIVPAAGHSRRMGTPKQLLDVRGEPMLAAVVRPVVEAGLAGVIVVVRRSMASAIQPLLPNGVAVEFNDLPEAEMIDSVRVGMRYWQQREFIRAEDGFLICPADQPGIAAADMVACRTVFEQNPGRIIVAERDSRRGHPLIFAATLTAFVESPACDPGLNVLPRLHPGLVLTVPCNSPGVTRDLDEPGDLRRLTE